jgi:hypothetical protein
MKAPPKDGRGVKLHQRFALLREACARLVRRSRRERNAAVSVIDEAKQLIEPPKPDDMP